MATPETLRIEVGDTELGVVRWHGVPGAPVVFAIHGITANAWSWAAVARHLDGDVGVVAIDLRGRGASSNTPEPYGMRQHADDVAVVIERFSAAPAVLVGHSMGTYVSLCCAERHPADTGRLVLVDGGVALPLPAGLSTQEALDATIGPAIARLRRVWSDRVAYRSMWSEHPAFAGGLTPEIERYVLSDLVPCEGGFRSSVNEDAVRFDGEELLTDADVRALLDRRSEPVIVVRAETGLMATPPPLLPPELMERYPQHDWRTVPGSNHYDVLIGEDGAAAIARAIRDATQCD
ncbi:MAG TPA: alpha/beta fold hydrolase [Ilumatobacter sp.]|nr:alpha/beta fold hydrolase [Ilumatobacter sp.]